MNERQRFSDLAGISDSEDAFDTFWPVNIMLILLAVALLSIAFYFLDAEDPRWVYNPWTYAVATPIVFLVFSALLSSVVSRVVEKSMQMAFLLSVLVHVLLLVYAMNIVIFSRMWPDLIESMAQERKQLERQSLQANQYHRISTMTQTGRRPDYLRHVPTIHQPTEVESADSPALALARSQRVNLVSPVPKVELSANPHMIERSKASPTMPSVTEHAATLSRSDLNRSVDSASAPEQPLLLFDDMAPTLLQPAATAASRKRSSSPSTLSGNWNESDTAELSSSPPDSSIRMERSERRVVQPTSPTAQPRSSQLAKQTPEIGGILPRGRESIEAPAVDAGDNLLPSLNGLAESKTELNTRSRSSSVSLANPTMSVNEPLIRASVSAVHNQRDDTRWRVPDPSAGEQASRLAKDSAGGRAGPPAASSMPVQGVPMLAGQQSAAQIALAPTTNATRRSTQRQSVSSAPLLGESQALSWNGQPSLSGGVEGMSLAELARDASNGKAASEDIASLSGAGREIERSRLGTPAKQGDISIPSVSELARPGQLEQEEMLAADIEIPMMPSAADSRRSMSESTTAGMLSRNGPELPLLALQTPRLPEGLNRAVTESAANETEWMRGEQEASRSVAPGEIDRSNTGQSAPANSLVIDIPAGQEDNDLSGGAGTDDRFRPAVASLERTRGDLSGTEGGLASMQLEIDALSGPGGLAPNMLSSGALLMRPDSLATNRKPFDLDSQRFERQQVGGPLAAGQDVAIPKPAFQQRLERLQDRNPLDETSAEPQTELAIERGLIFLAKRQRPDGSWRLQDFDTEVLMRSDTAATGLALLAFQGAGYTHKQFKYAEVVDKAITFLRERQKADGDLYIPQDPASDQNAWLYSHGIAALAMCEAYGMTQDPELQFAAQRSIDFMVSSQDPQRGGWRYRPGVGTDTSVTGWFMMAFQSGRLAGLSVPASTMQRLQKYIEAAQFSSETPHLYRYNPYAANTVQQRHGLQPTPVMTSVGLLMRLYFGWKRDRPEMVDGTDYLLRHVPQEGTRTNSSRDTYYWYYATQVLFHMGGERWERWHDELYPILIKNQVVGGENEGSWDPVLPTPDLWARYGGRLYVTTMNLLSLEVSYRHLPLYDATAR